MIIVNLCLYIKIGLDRNFLRANCVLSVGPACINIMCSLHAHIVIASIAPRSAVQSIPSCITTPRARIFPSWSAHPSGLGWDRRGRAEDSCGQSVNNKWPCNAACILQNTITQSTNRQNDNNGSAQELVRADIYSYTAFILGAFFLLLFLLRLLFPFFFFLPQHAIERTLFSMCQETPRVGLRPVALDLKGLSQDPHCSQKRCLL